MTVVTTIHERRILLCLFYSDTEKIRFVMFGTLLKCLKKLYVRLICFVDRNSGLSSYNIFHIFLLELY